MNTLPACCAPLQHHWPLPRPLPGAVLVSCAFDPTRLAPDDFQRAGVVPGASLQRSVAKRQAEYWPAGCAPAPRCYAGRP